MAPPYAIIFMSDLEEKLLIDYGKNLSHGGNMFLCRYFYVIGSMVKNNLKSFHNF